MLIKKPQPRNDNAPTREQPVVIVPRGRPDHAFARAENLILPLRFARRCEGWSRISDG